MMRWLVSLPVIAYRAVISPWKPRCCRFEPTCSQYALDALRQRGVCVGLLLTVWRVLRCQPFAEAGFDPVPPRPDRTRPRPAELPAPRTAGPPPQTPTGGPSGQA